ncbi:MAG: hypothetical protein GEU26_11610 [Nitrososphaeraceae archaeon]|nr:hypothetical protein [Nitrososphaeraceae archaeon]
MVILVCPRCKKPGFLSQRKVYAYYVPKQYSEICESYENALTILKRNPDRKEDIILVGYPEKPSTIRRIKLKDHVKDMQKAISGTRYANEGYGNTPYRIRKTYFHSYIGHYDREKYKKQKERYKAGTISYRPNGRRWCKMRSKDQLKIYFKTQKK